MPPKQKITKEMILDASFNIIKEDGYENLNARMVANKLNCSTQPIFSHYSSMNELKQDVYQKTFDYFCFWLSEIKMDENVLFDLAHRYIDFGYQENHLFCFIYQSKVSSKIQFDSILERLNITDEMIQCLKMTKQEFETLFQYFFAFVHSYASMLANDTIEYNENMIDVQLHNIYKGMQVTVKMTGDDLWKI